MRKRVQLAHDDARGWHANLPHYSMVAGTFQPIVAGLIHADGVAPDAKPADAIKHKVSCVVDIPHTVDLDPKGEIDAAKMRRRYPRDSMYGDIAYVPPRLLGDR
jgi:hypothetical protein